MSKTVHTPDPPTMLKTTMTVVTIQSIKRSSVAAAEVEFRSNMKSVNLRALFAGMNWQLPVRTDQVKKLDGTFKGGSFTLKAKIEDDKLAVLKSKNGDFDPELECHVAFDKISGFECHRLEIPGHVGKGHRREMRFKATFSLSGDFPISELERYMLCTDNAAGSLTIIYKPEEKNGTLPGMEEEPKLPGMDDADDEADADHESSIESVVIADGNGEVVFEGAAGDMKKAAEKFKQKETGTLASTRQMGAKRGRLNPEAN